MRGEISSKEAAFRINKSYRQTLRIIEKVQKKGLLGIKHGNLGKTPANKSCTDLKSKILKLYQAKYFDYNLTHALEKLEINHGCRCRRLSKAKDQLYTEFFP